MRARVAIFAEMCRDINIYIYIFSQDNRENDSPRSASLGRRDSKITDMVYRRRHHY